MGLLSREEAMGASLSFGAAACLETTQLQKQPGFRWGSGDCVGGAPRRAEERAGEVPEETGGNEQLGARALFAR